MNAVCLVSMRLECGGGRMLRAPPVFRNSLFHFEIDRVLDSCLKLYIFFVQSIDVITDCVTVKVKVFLGSFEASGCLIKTVDFIAVMLSLTQQTR